MKDDGLLAFDFFQVLGPLQAKTRAWSFNSDQLGRRVHHLVPAELVDEFCAAIQAYAANKACLVLAGGEEGFTVTKSTAIYFGAHLRLRGSVQLWTALVGRYK